ncbi:MAG: hypothetical protein N3A57_05030 [Negativicutes bacterium]|nr:hypothetical protein [Negativicutes bacterium]
MKITIEKTAYSEGHRIAPALTQPMKWSECWWVRQQMSDDGARCRQLTVVACIEARYTAADNGSVTFTHKAGTTYMSRRIYCVLN